MNKRIVKETLNDGSVQYRVEVQKWQLGWMWVTDSFYDGERDMYIDAVFESLAGAKAHANISDTTIVKREIVVET